MAYIKMVWAIFLGSVVGVILGIVFDWAVQNGDWVKLDPELIIYPWVAGGGAFFGALMAVIVIGTPKTNKQAAPVKTTSPPAKSLLQKVKPGAKSVKTKPAPAPPAKKAAKMDKDFVEGMPSFDFSASSKDIPAEPMPKNKGKK